MRSARLLWSLPLLLLVGSSCRQEGPPASRPLRAAEGPRADSPLPSPLPDVVARVNDEPIRASLLRFLAEDAMRTRKIPSEKVPRAYRQILDDLIVRELLVQEAIVRDVKVSDVAVDAAFDEARARYPDERSWDGFLARRGVDEAAFRLDVRARHLVQALVRAERAKVAQVQETEAREYYEAHPKEFMSGERARLRHILVRSPHDATPAGREAARVRAQALVTRLRGGEDFARLARAESADAQTAQRGGALGVRSRRGLPAPLADAVFALQPGGISGPIETPAGFEVILVEARLPDEQLSFDQVRSRLVKVLTERRRNEAVRRLVDDLWSKARVEILI